MSSHRPQSPGLNTAYSSAVLKSWRGASFIGGLLAGLYAVLYVLLSLEDFSLLIGSMLLFVALAGCDVRDTPDRLERTTVGGSGSLSSWVGGLARLSRPAHD